MGDTFKVGEFEFQWSITTSKERHVFKVLINKPRLFKFGNSFTSEEIETVAQKKHTSTEFLEIIKAGFNNKNPRVTLAYSFVEDTTDLDDIEPLNEPKTGSSLVLIIELKSEFADTSSRFYLPLKHQRPTAEEMASYVALQPSSTGVDNRLQVLELSHEVEELKENLELVREDYSSLHRDFENWKNKAVGTGMLVLIAALAIVVISTRPAPAPEEKVVYAQFVPNQAPLASTRASEYLQWQVTSAIDEHFMLSDKKHANDTITILKGGLYQVIVAATTTTTTTTSSTGYGSTSYLELFKNGAAVATIHGSSTYGSSIYGSSTYGSSTYGSPTYGSSIGNTGYHNYYFSNIFRCEATDTFQVHSKLYETFGFANSQHSQQPSQAHFTVLKLGNL
eukprot:Phypoly_transcript_10142.p1 GENE.Phypoly_transcript_10142~~Phypoly_transcript_10142.p1  ORF type:complete len:393 (+),score=43.53 Phypoly_transcript_10142:52-1230(+)